VSENFAVLDSIKQGFGKQELEGMIRVYEDEESRNKVELKHLIERTAGSGKVAEEGA